MDELNQKLARLKELSLEETDVFISELNDAFSQASTPDEQGNVNIDHATAFADAIEVVAEHRKGLVAENDAKLAKLSALKDKVAQFGTPGEPEGDEGVASEGTADEGEGDEGTDADADATDADDTDADAAEGDEGTDADADNADEGTDADDAGEGEGEGDEGKFKTPIVTLPKLKQNKAVTNSLQEDARFKNGVYIDPSTGREKPAENLTRALTNAAKSLSSNTTAAARGLADKRVLVGSIPVSSKFKVIDDDTYANAAEANQGFREIVAEKRKKKAELAQRRVASGGSCGPCEQDYEVNIIGEAHQDVADSLPTVAGNGRCQAFYKDLDFKDYYRSSTGIEESDLEGVYLRDSVGQYVEQDDIDGYGEGGKACYKLPCIDTARNVITLQTACLEIGNWQQMSHPELVEALKEAADNVYAADAESWRLRKINAAAITAGHDLNAAAIYTSASSSLLNAIFKVQETIKTASRLSGNPAVNVWLPRYAESVLTLDLAFRFSLGERLGVEQAIFELLRRKNISINYYDDSITTSTTDATVSGRLNPIVSNTIGLWPATVRILIARDDSIGRRLENSLDLGVFRTQADFEQNNYHLFMEQWESLSFRNDHIYAIDVPFCPSGGSAGTISPSCTGLTA